ncbi:CzcC family cobalt/zinc/cadmium efflux transporter outer membrane protein [Pseudomonas amygdali pv. ulmi]|uniref:CzcC family cobalt/zinc/cadmium efflux transporter outer membrane protein n=4 Tax=Pseudomonas TaxID=286 RepID=A0A0N8TB38_PSEA0|nr:CzcC family cobalt/zinc/cadmium efflux transporter outer membrane protein [Pseudomonas amygdali pv. aesculi]KPW82202.1 CzcC family cobalt/zinc/cadmium efflux transporter outer membrane protein [Pseudomonas syringae pv. cerasicola]KPZ06913.1 CzcC family cobalt/zinc/cadmium efflux transporter outer membrane protein [Pseudomonas amygdali pv. ulmi]RMS86256.1 Cobalt/zinc/cadmium efflux RND transporter, outer membrane protein [Pseudomonas savastanoi]RMR15201.1 CzcC family cobalt/zinc/cadmium efflu
MPGMKVAALCLLLLPFAAPGIAAAQGISLAQALEAAFARNPELAAAQWEIGVAEGDRQQAGLIPNPVVSWEVEDTRRETSTTTVMLSQALELGGKRGARIEAASKGQDAARLELERRGNELRAEVVQAFYAAARAQAGLDLARQSRTLAERGLQVAEGRVRAGKVSPVEATRAQVQLAETDLLVRRAETLKINSNRELARTTGSPVASFERLEYADLSPGKLPPSAKLLTAINQSAELRLAQAQIEQREAALGSERAKRIPDLTVSVGSQYSREESERVNVVGLSMPLPLFDRNQGNVLAASRRADQSRDLRNAVELKLRTQTQSALDQWSTAAQEVESFNQVILPAAQRAVDTATRGFEMGKFGFLEVLDAQRTLISARSQYLESLATATEARVAVERIHGDLNRFSLNP